MLTSEETKSEEKKSVLFFFHFCWNYRVGRVVKLKIKKAGLTCSDRLFTLLQI